MIRLLVGLGKWLDSRFPAKVVVTQAQYDYLHEVMKGHDEEISIVRKGIRELGMSLDKALERLSVVESNAVHKEPVQAVIKELMDLKEEYTSFKANMGFRPVENNELHAMLNGQYIPSGEEK